MTIRSARCPYWLSFTASALLLACQPAPSGPSPTPPQSTPPAQPAPAESADAPAQCSAAPGWREERIELPPAFAPSLPAGTELLWFAPGMFDPDADDYFSYVFELALSEAPTSSPAELQDLLQAYYAGLMQAVAKDSGRTPGEVVVSVEPAPDGHFVAAIDMTNEFNGGEPISVKLDLERTDTCLIATVTPSDDDGVRTALEQARSCLPCTSG